VYSHGECSKSGEVPPPLTDDNLKNGLIRMALMELGYRNESQFLRCAHKEYMAAWLSSRMDVDDAEEVEASSRAVQVALSAYREGVLKPVIQTKNRELYAPCPQELAN